MSPLRAVPGRSRANYWVIEVVMRPKKYKTKKEDAKKIRKVWAIKPVSRVAPDRRLRALKKIEEREKRESI